MNIPTEIWTFSGALITAFAGGAVSFLVGILTKDQKVSEFRQQWIDAERNDIAELAALFSLTATLKAAQDMDDERFQAKVDRHIATEADRMRHEENLHSFATSRNENLNQIGMCAIRAKLRLNPDEHINLIALIDQVIHDEDIYSDARKREIWYTSLIAESHVVFKDEWKRVKRGEPLVWIVRWVSGALAVCCLTAIVWLAWSFAHNSITFDVPTSGTTATPSQL